MKKIVFLFAMVGSAAQALTLDQYLEQARQKNSLFQAYEMAVQAADDKVDSAGLDLSPVLTTSYLKGVDKSLPSQISNERNISQYSIGLAKKFITGTSIKLQGDLADYKNPGTAFPGFDQYSTGALGVSVSQSLWKDFFGYGTRTKLQREKSAAQIERTAAELQRRAYLIQMEADFWDYIVASEDVRLKKANLERAEKLQKWTANRVSNGISDKADLMNIKALTSLRSVQYQNSVEDLKTAETKIRENLGLSADQATPTIDGQMTQERNYIKSLASSKNVLSLEAEVARLEASTKKNVADEVTDQLRPDLSVFGTYATTSYNRDRSEAISKVTDSDYPKTSVGVQFSWVIETDAKSGARGASQKEALASQYKAERKVKDGVNAWNELLRKYQVAVSNVKTLEDVATFQRERSKAEQDKFLKGRTVTANVVTAETDAAEAEVNLLKAKSGLRKLEASSQLFFAENNK